MMVQGEIPEGDLSVDAAAHHESGNRRIESKPHHVLCIDHKVVCSMRVCSMVRISLFSLFSRLWQFQWRKSPSHLFSIQRRQMAVIIVAGWRRENKEEKKREKKPQHFRQDKG